MKKLIKRSYHAIRKRGFITDSTTKMEFIEKIYEEYDEVLQAWHSNVDTFYIEELTDLATVVILQIHHLGYDFIEEFKKCIIKNETRND